MLVDDELPLLQLVEKYLTRLGFEVEPHSTSQNALQNFEASPSRYDIVIADLGMPDVPGDTLLTTMLERQPRLVALVCSGSEFFTSTPIRRLSGCWWPDRVRPQRQQSRC